MARTRRTYTPEFKAEAVKLVTEQGYSVAEAARSLGINDNLIRNWKHAVQAQGDQAFPVQGNREVEALRLDRGSGGCRCVGSVVRPAHGWKDSGHDPSGQDENARTVRHGCSSRCGCAESSRTAAQPERTARRLCPVDPHMVPRKASTLF